MFNNTSLMSFKITCVFCVLFSSEIRKPKYYKGYDSDRVTRAHLLWDLILTRNNLRLKRNSIHRPLHKSMEVYTVPLKLGEHISSLVWKWKIFFMLTMLSSCRRRGTQMASKLYYGTSNPYSNPGLGIALCSRAYTLLSQCLSSPRSINEYWRIVGATWQNAKAKPAMAASDPLQDEKCLRELHHHILSHFFDFLNYGLSVGKPKNNGCPRK